MKDMIYRIGGQATEYTYRRLRLEKTGFLKLVSYEVEGSDHRYDMMVRGDAVVILPIDLRKREVYLIETPRHVRAFTESEEGKALLEKAVRDGWTTEEAFTLPRPAVVHLEAPAGTVDKGETPEEAAVRELREETGLIVETSMLEKIAGPYYPSVGGTSERVTLFFAALPDPVRYAESLSEEDRASVTVWKLGFDDVFRLLEDNAVITASANIAFRELFIRDRMAKEAADDHADKLG